MADTEVPVAPPGAPSTPFQIKFASATDANGVVTQIQCVTLVDELGRPVYPMTEATGQALLQAIRELTNAVAAGNSDTLIPSTPGLIGG